VRTYASEAPTREGTWNCSRMFATRFGCCDTACSSPEPGSAIGVAAGLALGRVVASLLYGVRLTDPATLLAVALFVVAVAAAAMYLPASRAARVDPMVALRIG
jgi:hypothetical protein